MARFLLFSEARVNQLVIPLQGEAGVSEEDNLSMKIGLIVWWVAAATASAQVQFAFTNWAGLPGISGTSDGTNTGANFASVFSLGKDASDVFYVGDYVNHTIRKVTPAAVVTTLAGTALASGTNDGTGTAARFNHPDGI